MKNMIISSFIILSINAFAGQGKEGGTPARAKLNFDERAYSEVFRSLKTMIETGSLKQRMVYIIKNMYDNKIKKLNISKADFIRDIKKSKYKIANKGETCLDKYGVSKFATSGMNDFGGEVCFDLSKIYQDDHLIDYQEFLAIAFHEHLHHFGRVDRDHSQGVDMAESNFNLPWNIIHGSCSENLVNLEDSFNYRIYADDFVERNSDETEKEELLNFKTKALQSIRAVYQLSGCFKGPQNLKLNCKKVTFFPGDRFSGEFICKAESSEGYMYLMEDMLGFMNVNFMRWD